MSTLCGWSSAVTLARGSAPCSTECAEQPQGPKSPRRKGCRQRLRTPGPGGRRAGLGGPGATEFRPGGHVCRLSAQRVGTPRAGPGPALQTGEREEPPSSPTSPRAAPAGPQQPTAAALPRAARRHHRLVPAPAWRKRTETREGRAIGPNATNTHRHARGANRKYCECPLGKKLRNESPDVQVGRNVLSRSVWVKLNHCTWAPDVFWELSALNLFIDASPTGRRRGRRPI